MKPLAVARGEETNFVAAYMSMSTKAQAGKICAPRNDRSIDARARAIKTKIANLYLVLWNERMNKGKLAPSGKTLDCVLKEMLIIIYVAQKGMDADVDEEAEAEAYATTSRAAVPATASSPVEASTLDVTSVSVTSRTPSAKKASLSLDDYLKVPNRPFQREHPPVMVSGSFPCVYHIWSIRRGQVRLAGLRVFVHRRREDRFFGRVASRSRTT